MNRRRLVLRALAYYWRTNLAVVAGVATAVAVLAGALVVGDSVRGTLRQLALDRIGATDLVVTAPRFFREALADDIRSDPRFESRFARIAPMVVSEALVTAQVSGRRAGRVLVYGVDDRFWRFHGVDPPPMGDRGALVSPALAAETGLDTLLAARLRESERRALAAVRCVVVTSHATAATIACEYGVARPRVVVVEPGTEPRPIATGSHDRALHMVCVATLVPRKGHEILLEVLADVPPGPWRLTCAGSADLPGSTAARLQTQLQTRGLTGRVTLSGEADGPVLAALYDSADIFVLPTLHEGYGMAVAEALACGLPVVSTATGAIPGLVGDAGLIVPPGDRHALASALNRMMGDESLRGRCALAARQARGRLPTWAVAVTKMAAVLESSRFD
jgi:glycosyltransferase involved in cell wall biosynthesis